MTRDAKKAPPLNKAAPMTPREQPFVKKAITSYRGVRKFDNPPTACETRRSRDTERKEAHLNQATRSDECCKGTKALRHLGGVSSHAHRRL